VFLRAAFLAMWLAISLTGLGGTRTFAEEAPASGSSAAKEAPVKEKPHANETAGKPKASVSKKASAGKETGTKPSSAQSGVHHTHDIDSRLPAPPARRTGPAISPIVIVPHPTIPSSHLPQVGVRPVTPGLPPVHSQGGDGARSAFGAVTHQSPGLGIKPAAPVIAVAPVPNHAVINGTTMNRHATGPAMIGGPAKNPGVINGTTIRRKP
jgi:hypothetical protein